MKIRELKERCDVCRIVDYCPDHGLCMGDGDLADVEETEFLRLAEGVTEKDIVIKQYDYAQAGYPEDGVWGDDRKGAICDIVSQKLHLEKSRKMGLIHYYELCFYYTRRVPRPTSRIGRG